MSSCKPRLRRFKQEDDQELEASIGHKKQIASQTGTEQDPVSKKKTKQ